MQGETIRLNTSKRSVSDCFFNIPFPHRFGEILYAPFVSSTRPPAPITLECQSGWALCCERKNKCFALPFFLSLALLQNNPQSRCAATLVGIKRMLGLVEAQVKEPRPEMKRSTHLTSMERRRSDDKTWFSLRSPPALRIASEQTFLVITLIEPSGNLSDPDCCCALISLLSLISPSRR